MIRIALLEPETPGNVGAVARVMKNFGFSNLILINPKCDYLGEEAVARAKHAKDVLKKAEVVKSMKSLRYDYLIGTTGKIGSSYNVTRLTITPEHVSERIPKNARTIILFGREGIGMTNEEIEKCDIVVNIPTAGSNYKVLNLSHAAAIILYELAKVKQKQFQTASKKEREAIFNLAGDVIGMVKWSKASSPQTVRTVLRNILNRAFIHKREAYTLAGFFRKIRHGMKR